MGILEHGLSLWVAEVISVVTQYWKVEHLSSEALLVQ
jgi:hypothetical protein